MPQRFPTGSEWQGALQLLRGMQDKSIPASVISSLGNPWLRHRWEQTVPTDKVDTEQQGPKMGAYGQLP